MENKYIYRCVTEYKCVCLYVNAFVYSYDHGIQYARIYINELIFITCGSGGSHETALERSVCEIK